MKLTFGKYKGCEIEDIIKIDASYLLWANDKALYIYKQTIYPFRHALSLGGVVNAMYKDLD